MLKHSDNEPMEEVENENLEVSQDTSEQETNEELNEIEQDSTEEASEEGEEQENRDNSNHTLPKKAQKRINTLTKRNKIQAEILAQKDKELEYYRSLMSQEVDFDKLSEEERYKHVARTGMAEDQVRRISHEREELRAKAQAEAWEEKVNEFIDEAPDFREVMRATTIQLPNEAMEFIRDSDEGARIAYHLAKNPDEAENLKYLSPKSLERSLLKLELRLEQGQIQSKKQVTKAPRPTPNPTDRKGQGVPKKLEDLSGDEYLREYRRLKAQKRR